MLNNNKTAPAGAKKITTSTIVGLGLLTAIVVVLQALAVGIRFGMFNITFVLIPIIVGAALYGWQAGAWLGAVFGVVVLFTDAGPFLAVNIPGTILTCVLKGIAAGVAAGLIYKALSKKNEIVAVLTAAVAAPVANTGVFLLGCVVFFLDTISQWSEGAGFPNVGTYMVVGLVGINFLVELGINLILSSAIVTIINVAKKTLAKKNV